MEGFLIQLFIFLAASAISVPIAKKLGLGSVLGYLIAGIVIRPLISDVESVMHFTEFGVVMMLFIVGLELKPSLLMKMKVPILGVGGTQVLLTGLAISLICMIFLPWQESIAIGLALALSSTAIVVQTLKEKGLMNTESGRSVFSVLLFQDLAVIPIMAFLPLLATHSLHSDSHSSTVLFDIHGLPGYQQVMLIFLSLTLIYVVAKYLSKPVFRIIAQTHVREIFIAAALVLVVGITLLMTLVGLSPALGTFLAGVVLAESEYKHELESDIEPFKGLLLGIFFISIGASLDFNMIGNNLMLILGISIGLILVKALVLYIIGALFKFSKENKTFFSISLAQGGEFAFVLFTFAATNGVLELTTIEPFIAAVAISMFFAPILFKIYEIVISKQINETENKDQHETIDVIGRKVILTGFGELGVEVGRFLLSAGIKPVILDNDSSNIELLRKLGFEVYYGDVTRLDLLEAAGISDAELLINSITDYTISNKLVELVKKHYPNLKIISTAKNYIETFGLMDNGVENVRIQSLGTALTMGQDVLVHLGIAPYDSYRLARIFKKHSYEMINELYEVREEDKYISTYKKQLNSLEDLMTLDLEFDKDELDLAWVAKDPTK